MLICSPDDAKSLYSDIVKKCIETSNGLNLPEDENDYRNFISPFRRKPGTSYIGSGAFRTAFKVKMMVLKIPHNWQGARQNIVEYATAMAQLPFTPKGTRLIIYSFDGFDIPVLLLPYQDLSVRDDRSVWDIVRPYNYTGDWAQYGKVLTTQRYALTDWALIKGDVSARHGGKPNRNPLAYAESFFSSCCWFIPYKAFDLNYRRSSPE